MSTINLNPEQKKAVEHGDGPLLIVAGAGTGKTTVITERIKHLILRDKISPDQILALTFTEKAAKEMEDRVDRIMPYGYTEMWISTFHSFCDIVLRQEALNIGLNPSYRLLSESESILLLKKNIFKFNLSYYRPLGNPTKFMEALLQHFSRLKDEDVLPEKYFEFAKKLKDDTASDGEILTKQQLLELAETYKQFEELKIQEGVMDFGDLISNTLKLFRTRKNILKKYQDKFKFILVDEFQDTNYAQNELAIQLAGDKKNITVVADDDQAIYRWRGAAISNVMQFRENFPGADVISLTRNYRSTQEILDGAYRMIQNNNPNRLELTEKISKKLTSERKVKGKKVEVIFTNRLDEEAEAIALKITELVENKTYAYRDIALLVRANNHAHPISQFLQRKRIPFQFLGPGQLFHQEEIKDLIAYLKVLSNLTDSVSLFRILSMDFFDIPERDLNYLLNLSKKKNLTLFETLTHMDETYIAAESKTKMKMVYDTIVRHLERIKKDTAGQILYYFLVDTGLYNNLLNYKTQREEKIALNIAKFFDKLKTFEYQTENSGVYQVVDWIDLMSQLGESPIIADIDKKDLNAVNILTVHSSKGLEFPVVFVVNLVNDRFPARERSEKIPLPNGIIKTKSTTVINDKKTTIDVAPANYHIQEERRLFYVAMTRAKDLLFLTGAKFYGEGKREKKLSPFVFEALPDFVENVEEEKPEQLSLLNLPEIFKDYKKAEDKTLREKIRSISYSQIQTFDICPLHYKAKYILGIPTPPTGSLSFGITLHNTLYDFYLEVQNQLLKNNKTKINIQLINEMLQKNWLSEGYQDIEYEKEAKIKAKSIVSKFFNEHFNPNNIPKALEMPFSFRLSNGLKVVGKIDRVDKLDDGTIEIIDYKTGLINANSKSSYNFQLSLYGFAATKINNPLFKRDLKNIKLTLFYLETGEKMTQTITEKDLTAVETKLISKVKEIEESDYKCSKNILCGSCEYQILCSVVN